MMPQIATPSVPVMMEEELFTPPTSPSGENQKARSMSEVIASLEQNKATVGQLMDRSLHA